MVKTTVYVQTIIKEGTHVTVTAKNTIGPSVTWVLPSNKVADCFIGKSYTLTIEDN
jgi:hypothetical protein